jgi:N6-L-threonylcarbamoyladenine synthase
MRILSIETSCDDTAITIFEAKGGIENASFKILANNSNSQIKIHRPHGGVFPALAKREHIKNLPIVLEKSLKEARVKGGRTQVFSSDKAVNARGERKNLRSAKPVDLIAVTSGPGLEPSLWSGIVFAKELAEKWNVPLIPVNHMEGHILSVFGKSKGKFKIKKLKMPILSLLVSGGHTELVLTKKWLKYEIIGQTLDDAVGEAFDKVARMLGLPYPGGPEISKLAERLRKIRYSREGSIAQADEPSIAIRQQANMRAESGQISDFSLPRPMLHSKNFDFSFSGLKTAVLYLIRDLSKEHSNILQNDQMKSAIALEFENAAIESLTHKTKKAIEKYKIKTVIVAGGVAANQYLRNEMQKITGNKIKLLFPTKELTMDNSIMIGIAGYLNYIKNKKKVPKINSIKAEGNLRLK